ncbi:ABC transporter ATP-binding protein [Thermosynechococcaceae cyanobacterium BACA0444]|uniref:ABC transporter ATP-binding protein n=2 Tax=Pseudocalidococcus TaxID=3110321 RepID=A0AAE4JWK6_9CYAN|nr:ABC transporter ATP-binding protein [Pseudocalidococcus azoricus]MDS3860263.1 ABC transporter ATP-binding protein [Pseudocalidococcus azoricus BACA0444]
MPTPMIEVNHLNKVYGSTQALGDVSFQAEAGEILGLLGPNGAGKTTTMRILSGYLPASRGTAAIDGFEVHQDPMAVRQRIGYLPESPPLYPEMSVAQYLNFVAEIKGVSAGDRPQQVKKALLSCGLEDKAKTLIRKLSKGYRQRVGIAQAIVHDPPAIILDEPTVGLDPRQIIEVRKLIQQLAGERTVILSTHILPEVSMTCNRVVIINRGNVVATGSLDELMTQLAGGYRYELEVRGEKTQIEAVLSSILSQEATTLAWGDPLNKDLDLTNLYRLHLTLPGSEDLGATISRRLIEAGLDLYEMRRNRDNLEDVFLKLTTQEDITPEARPAPVPSPDPAAPDSDTPAPTNP